MYLRDLAGDEYVIQATTVGSYELNGNQELTVVLEHSKVNKPIINEVSEMWELIDDNEITHKVIYCRNKSIGRVPVTELKSIPLFYDYFMSTIVYEAYNGSMTAHAAFTALFENTPYNFSLQGSFSAVSWENFCAGEHRIKSFQRALDRYGAEFRISGNTIIIEDKIGRDIPFMYRYQLNASNIVNEVDAENYWTYAKGYGDYGSADEDEAGDSNEWEDAKIVREYTSPLAELLGKRDAPPIKDGRITHIETMDKSLKKLVDESLKISITANIQDLVDKGYDEAQPERGDRISLIDERIGLQEELRVVKIEETKNWKNEIINLELTLGSPSIVSRQKSTLKSVQSRVDDLFSGHSKLPFNVLDNAVIQATKALQNAQTELIFPPTGGILAVDRNNPNLVTLFNSAGIGVSRDGGQTFKNAITGEGIVAESIIAGIVDGLIINGGEVRGGLISTTGVSNHIEIQNGIMKTFYNGEETSRITGRAHIFRRDGRTVGNIGTDAWLGDPSYRGLSFQLEYESDYMHWGYRKDPADNFYTTVMSWHKTNKHLNKGINFSDDVYVNSGFLQVGNTSGTLRVGDATLIQSMSGSASFGPNDDTYLIVTGSGELRFYHQGHQETIFKF